MHELQQLGERIALCDERVWDELELNEETREAMRNYTRLNREAKRRQAQYIGRLLRGYDYHALSGFFATREHARRHRDALAAKLPSWYRGLVSGTLAWEEIADQFPEVDSTKFAEALSGIGRVDPEFLPIPPKEKKQKKLWLMLVEALPRVG